MANKKKIICVVGSLNQTKQLHRISQYLQEDFDIYFTQIYGDGLFYRVVAESGIMDNTVLGKDSSFTKLSREYILDHQLQYDYRAQSKNNQYDLALLSTDMIVPKSLRKIKSIWVQEGMIDPIKASGILIKKLGLPTYFTSDTSLNGTSNKADIYCAMSSGYKDYFSKWGTNRNKIILTGVPNFDDIASFAHEPYSKSGFVLIATSDIRELGGNDNRVNFFNKCKTIAEGKKVIYKPHPNENLIRVTREIKMVIPDVEIITKPILDTLIAHCDTFITQWSSSAYVGLVMGKKVFSYFPIEELEAKKPIQNGGRSAEIIAQIAREFIFFEGDKRQFITQSEYVQQYM